MSAPPTGGRDWAARYEALRAQATGEGLLGSVPLGLAVLRHRGVVAWMAAEARSLEPPERRAPRGRGDPTPQRNLLSGRSELVGLLAGAALLVAKGAGR